MRGYVLLAIVLVCLSAHAAYGAKCTGSASCAACTSCSRCAHCKGGGTCGVCARQQASPTPPPQPTEPPAAIDSTKPETPTKIQHIADATPSKAVESENGVTLYLSPNGGCTDAIVEQIKKATREVRVQAYRLTSPPIAKALVDAHKRGIDVKIILDKSQQSAKYSDATYFHNADLAVLIDDDHAIAHNKIVIIDKKTVITGSFNFSQAAEKSNAENLLILDGLPQITTAYVQNFEEHAAHSSPYKAPTEPYRPTTQPTEADPAASTDDGDEPAQVAAAVTSRSCCERLMEK